MSFKLSFALYVIDIPHSYGPLPVPLSNFYTLKYNPQPTTPQLFDTLYLAG
jgi:hypothetical protein